MGRTKKPLINMNAHIVLTTRGLLNKLEDAQTVNTIRGIAEETCAKNDATLLSFETGLKNEHQEILHRRNAMHLYVNVHGDTDPITLTRTIISEANRKWKSTADDGRTILGTGFFISDDKNYTPDSAINFTKMQSSNQSRKTACAITATS